MLQIFIVQHNHVWFGMIANELPRLETSWSNSFADTVWVYCFDNDLGFPYKLICINFQVQDDFSAFGQGPIVCLFG